MPETYRSIMLAKRPIGEIIPNETFRTETSQIPQPSALRNGQVLLQSHYLSLDPAMRGWLNDTRSYIPPVQLGAVMRGAVIGQVVASKSPRFPTGTYALATSGWTEYAVLADTQLEPVAVPANARVTDALGVLGMTSLTAYFGILDVGKVKAGDFVVVSGAAGATGSMVGQIAKIMGATVLGIAGSREKVEWLKSVGFDEALNYMDEDFGGKFRRATSKLIDVFFDNVGGEVLDLALGRAKPHARFVMCGGISQYNATNPQGPKNYLMIISMRIRMQGFIVFDYESRYDEARKQLYQWLEEGKLQRKETIIRGGLRAAPQALADLYKGVNTGKLLVEVKSDAPKASL